MSSVEDTIPPITTVASGRCTSAPAPTLSAMGTKPSDATRLEELKAGLLEVLDRAPQGPAGRRITPVRASVRDVSDLEGEIGRKPVSSGSRAR